MNSLTLCLLTVMMSASANRRRFHERFRINISTGVWLSGSVGTPQHNLSLTLDTRTGNLIIMEAACENPRIQVQCPSYCGGTLASNVWLGLYCSPLCSAVTMADKSIRCGVGRLFNATKSSTFVDFRTDFSTAFRGLRPLHGRLGRETIRLKSAVFRKTMEKDQIRFKLKNITERLILETKFVRGLSFDKRMMSVTSSGVIGLSPRSPNGHPSIVPQLKQKGHLGRARISLQKSAPLVFSTFAMPLETVMLGDFDKYACHSWAMMDAYTPLDWTFEMSDVRFAGEKFPGPHVGRISLDNLHAGIPYTVADHFIRAGLLIPPSVDRKTFTTHRSNWTLIQLEFKFGNKQILIEAEKLVYPLSMNTHLYNYGESRYTDEVQWSFGVLLLEHFCYGYDYDRGAVAWAERRRPGLQ